MRKIILLATVIGMSSSYAHATYWMRGDMGGKIPEHEAKYRAIAASGESIVIDGLCQSSCTVLLDMFPPNRICITPRASFNFHAGPGPIKTEMMESHYPPAFRAWVRRHHAMEKTSFTHMSYREIPLRHCKK